MTRLETVLALHADSERMTRPGDVQPAQCGIPGDHSPHGQGPVRCSGDRYADQLAHDVAWMTVSQREAYDRRIASVDIAVRARAVTGQLVSDHGDGVTVMHRDPPAPHPEHGQGNWIAPYSVNCARHGWIVSRSTPEQARQAAVAHLARESHA